MLKFPLIALASLRRRHALLAQAPAAQSNQTTRAEVMKMLDSQVRARRRQQ